MGLKWVVFFVLLDVSIQNVAATGLNIEVFSVTQKSIIFKWNHVSGVSSYKITLALKGTTETKAFATFDGLTVIGSVHGLEPNTEYTYTIDALDNSNIMITTESKDSFTAPDGLTNLESVTPKDSSSVEVVFTPKTGVNKYVIRILNPADSNFIRQEEVTASPAEITGLAPYTEYEFSIMSANDAGRSQPSDSLTAKTLLSALQIQSSSSTNSTIELTWAAVPNAVLYTVCLLKHQASASDKITQNTTNLSFTFSNLEHGALYHIESYAWDLEDRKGEYSAESNQTTRPPAPESVTVTIVRTYTQLGLSVTWTLDPVYGEVWYNVSTDQGQTCSNTTQMCELMPVSCGTVYTVEVIAQNDAGPSVPSFAVIFTTVPCPPETLAVSEASPWSCNFTWDTVPHADGYKAYIKNADGSEKNCSTTGTSCSFTCECGYTYLMSVFAHNGAGISQQGPELNYTTTPCCPTMTNLSLVNPDTLEIEWAKARGAVLYETRANDSAGVILCNDTAPLCVLSSLKCDTPYSLKVIPCSDLSGCNHNCPVYTKDTGLCTSEAVTLTKVNSSTVTVSWTTTNREATYIATAKGGQGDLNCSSISTSCNIDNLPCGSMYEVGVTATDLGGQSSFASYTVSHETEPCYPTSLTVKQVTQSMTNVSWTEARGAHTFRTSLTSTKGHASCHTGDTHCVMGCITCGTNYTVSMEVYSLSGLQSNHTYQGFSSSLCCPSGVRIYRINTNNLRVSWRSSQGASHVTLVTMKGFRDYNCTAQAGESFCDISEVFCGDEYTVVVAPVKDNGSTEDFCAHRKYAVSCAGNHVGAILFRGKRSVE